LERLGLTIRRNSFPGRCCVPGCAAEVSPNTGYLYPKSDAVIESLRIGEAKWLTICSSPKCFAAFHGRTARGVDARPALLADGTVIVNETEDVLPFLRAMATLEVVDGSSRWRALRNPGDRPHVLAVAAKLGLDVDPSWASAEADPAIEAVLADAKSLGVWAYQLDGIRWLATRASDDTARGCLLADEMGLGKSVQVLLSLRADEALVVVCPKSAIGVWQNEIKRWCPDRFDVVIVVADTSSFAWPRSTREAVIVTYDQLPYTRAMIANERAALHGKRNGIAPKPTAKKQADKLGVIGAVRELTQIDEAIASLPSANAAELDKLLALREKTEKTIRRLDLALARNAERRVVPKPTVPVVVALDEAHRVARAKTKRTTSVRGMTTSARRVIGMTGTPVEDDPFVLSSLLTTCGCNPFDRELLLHSFHAHKLAHGGFEFEREPSTTPGAKGAIKVRPGVPELLRRVLLRRRQVDVLAFLPPLVFSEIPVPLDARLLAALDAIAADEEVRRLVAEGELPPFGKIAEVRALLAAALVPMTLEIVEEHELQSTPLVVFAEHTVPIEALRNRPGWAVITGAGTTISGKSATRAEAVASFQSGESIGFAGTIASCGDAITLTRACRMLFVDLAYAHRQNTQAFKRCHRPGQEECVHISTFVPDHPIARHVAAVLARKSDFAVAVLDSTSDVPVTSTRTTLGLLASDLDADTSERRAVVRARLLRLVLPTVDASVAATIEREADAAVRAGRLGRAEISTLAGLLPGAAAGRGTALASALVLLGRT
jgi:hypothetical protein